MKSYSPYQIVLILTPFVFSFAFGLDIYIPIAPQMTEIFGTSPAMIQLTLSLFLFTTGFGQLFIGPLADRFGRKPIFYASSFCFLLGSLGCAFSSNIGELIASRVVSAFGACGMIVASFAVVRDLYSSTECAKMYSFLNGAVSISPTFAPIIGGYLSLYFGWQSVFFGLAFIGAFAFLITRLLISETKGPATRYGDVLQDYLKIVTHRQFFIFSSLSGLAEGILFCFFSISPFIIIGLHGISTHEFGYYFAVFGTVIGLGGFLSGKACEKLGIYKTVLMGIALMLIGGFSMITCHFFIPESLTGFLIPMAIACAGSMSMLGASTATALEPFGSIAGTASAAFGAIQFGLSALAGSILMLFPVTSTFPYGIAILMTGGASILLFSLRKETLLLRE